MTSSSRLWARFCYPACIEVFIEWPRETQDSEYVQNPDRNPALGPSSQSSSSQSSSGPSPSAAWQEEGKGQGTAAAPSTRSPIRRHGVSPSRSPGGEGGGPIHSPCPRYNTRLVTNGSKRATDGIAPAPATGSSARKRPRVQRLGGVACQNPRPQQPVSSSSLPAAAPHQPVRKSSRRGGSRLKGMGAADLQPTAAVIRAQQQAVPRLPDHTTTTASMPIPNADTTGTLAPSRGRPASGTASAQKTQGSPHPPRIYAMPSAQALRDEMSTSASTTAASQGPTTDPVDERASSESEEEGVYMRA